MKNLSIFLAFVLVLTATTAAYPYGGGDGSPEDPYRIGEPNDLIEMSQNPDDWSEHFILTADINLNLAEPNTFTTAVIAPDTDDSTLGFQGTAFAGVFDGNGHIVSHLTIDTAGAGNDYLGLFGQIEGPSGEVKNLGLKNVHITGGADSTLLGGLCGYNRGSVSNCCSTGSVTGEGDSWYLGGLCGHNDGMDYISNCYFLDTAGPHNDWGTPLTDPSMKQQSSFVGWDFVGDSNGSEDHWQLAIDGYDYPRLTWQFVSSADFLYPGAVNHYDLMEWSIVSTMQRLPSIGSRQGSNSTFHNHCNINKGRLCRT